MRTWYANNKAVVGLVAMCVVAAVLGAILIVVVVSNRPQLSEADKSRAVGHCVQWVTEYTKAPNPIIRCQDAEKKDADAFYSRWASGR